MSATLLLVRHGHHAEVGQVLSGRSEVALDAEGQVETAALAARLAAVHIDAIRSSPRRRAVETARIVGGDRPVETVDALDEIDFGDWTGRRFADLADDPAWRHWNAERATARPPRGEAMAAAVARARDYLTTLTGTVLCVSHCDVIRGLIADWMGMGYQRMLDFDCDPASLTTVRIDRGHVRLIALNERAA